MTAGYPFGGTGGDPNSAYCQDASCYERHGLVYLSGGAMTMLTVGDNVRELVNVPWRDEYVAMDRVKMVWILSIDRCHGACIESLRYRGAYLSVRCDGAPVLLQAVAGVPPLGRPYRLEARRIDENRYMFCAANTRRVLSPAPGSRFTYVSNVKTGVPSLIAEAERLRSGDRTRPTQDVVAPVALDEGSGTCSGSGVPMLMGGGGPVHGH